MEMHFFDGNTFKQLNCSCIRMKYKILITGAQGLIAQTVMDYVLSNPSEFKDIELCATDLRGAKFSNSFYKLASKYQIPYLESDITFQRSFEDVLRRFAPHGVINFAGFFKPGGDKDLLFKVNGFGAECVANA